MNETNGMKVIPFAWSMIDGANLRLFLQELGFEIDWLGVSDLDTIAEFAGRACYLSFKKPNPNTAANEAYLAHILESAHESVLEHSSVTFYVTGVSRNLLLELERHRHISFSVLSTRYVSAERFGNVIHPNTPENLVEDIAVLDVVVRDAYEVIFDTCINKGYTVKEAREVARQVLPGSSETRFLVTGNLRAWRDIIKKRIHPTADKEIQLFAKEILAHLREMAPNSVQDL